MRPSLPFLQFIQLATKSRLPRTQSAKTIRTAEIRLVSHHANPLPAITMQADQTKNQEPRTKNQEPRTKNQEPRTKNQEPRTKNQEPRTAALSD
jgi:hypothetical protein